VIRCEHVSDARVPCELGRVGGGRGGTAHRTHAFDPPPRMHGPMVTKTNAPGRSPGRLRWSGVWRARSVIPATSEADDDRGYARRVDSRSPEPSAAPPSESLEARTRGGRGGLRRSGRRPPRSKLRRAIVARLFRAVTPSAGRTRGGRAADRATDIKRDARRPLALAPKATRPPRLRSVHRVRGSDCECEYNTRQS
jgi:hypothetical protein